MLGRTAVVALASLATMACANSTGPAEAVPAVLAVVPASGATGVSLTAPVMVTFSHSMMPGMEANVLLHEGLLTGPVITGSAAWSTDRRTLTFTPSAALKPGTTYLLHLAPTLVAANGQGIDHGACTALGGQNVTGAMTGGGMMGSGMMGSGWEMSSGSYGMIFRFTTA
ncbi:MAG TPA: Ig-like domain-containing protein [Gemmatimonadaceae bacterium]|nr:Ig-like domain-containing protein [Gemmatimonadaceae bacterium]